MIRINVMTSNFRQLLSNRRYQERNKVQHRQRCADYYAANAARMKARQKGWLDNPRNREADYDRRYGKGASQHRRMQLIEQNNVCAICNQTFTGRLPDIDHNHDTQQLRGILCSPCNKALGMFRDDIDIVESAARYLRKWEANSVKGD
jgi:hypothetical protein